MIVVDSQVLFYGIGKGKKPVQKAQQTATQAHRTSVGGRSLRGAHMDCIRLEFCRQAEPSSMTDMSLRFVGLHVKTLRSYKRALLSFFNWLDDENIPFRQEPPPLMISWRVTLSTYGWMM